MSTTPAVTPNPTNVITAVLGLPQADYPGKIVIAKAIVKACTANPAVPVPAAQIATCKADIVILDDAEAAVKTGAVGTVAARDAAWKVVPKDLNKLKILVQDAADADIPNAVTIIEGAGMKVKKAGTHGKQKFEAVHGTNSGEVTLKAAGAGKSGFHDWEYSTDQTNWIHIMNSNTAKKDLTGLAAPTLYYFRHRTISKDIPSVWEFCKLTVI